MTSERKRKGLLEYKVPMWLRRIAAVYLIFVALIFMYDLGKGGPPNPFYDVLFVLGFGIIVMTYFLWAFKQKGNAEEQSHAALSKE